MAATSKSARICETCGTPTEATSSGDFGCIVCLFDIGLGPDVVEGHETFAETPERLGAYTIERHADGSPWELGHGAMGVTYRAIDKALDRPVALKIINTNLGSRSGEARERFTREARAAAALRHPNVATVHQFGVREETGESSSESCKLNRRTCCGQATATSTRGQVRSQIDHVRAIGGLSASTI